MTRLIDVSIKLCREYPFPSELSKARFNKLLYLSDWRAAINHEKQITTVKWYYNHFGPYVEKVIYELEESGFFKVINSTNYYGEPKQILGLSNPNLFYRLESWENQMINEVIAETSKLSWDEFIKLVYSTYPIMSSEKFNELNLIKLAHEYKSNYPILS